MNVGGHSTAIGGVRERQRPDLVYRLERGRLGMALVDWWQVLAPVEALGLEPALPLVETSPVNPSLPASLGDVAQLLGQFNNTQPPLRHLADRITRRGLPRSL